MVFNVPIIIFRTTAPQKCWVYKKSKIVRFKMLTSLLICTHYNIILNYFTVMCFKLELKSFVKKKVPNISPFFFY